MKASSMTQIFLKCKGNLSHRHNKKMILRGSPFPIPELFRFRLNDNSCYIEIQARLTWKIYRIHCNPGISLIFLQHYLHCHRKYNLVKLNFCLKECLVGFGFPKCQSWPFKWWPSVILKPSLPPISFFLMKRNGAIVIVFC